MTSQLTVVLLLGAACAAATPAPTTRLAEPRASHTASRLADGSILVAGGFRKGPDGHSQLYTATTEIVDARGVARPGPALVEARAGHLAVTLRDGRILIAGGGNGSPMRSAELYDPQQRRFARIADLSEPREGATATLLQDGRVLIAGGGFRVSTRSAELYDPRDGRFHPTGELASGRLGHTATLLRDGRVLVVGGERASHDILASAEIYDPKTGTFAPTGALAAARYKHAAALLDDGRVLVMGGSDARDWRGKLATTELYDPATGRFSRGPALTVPRFKLPSAIAVVGGEVVVAGGGGSIERVRPGVESRAIATVAARFYSTATLLGDRLVLIGGYDDHAQTHDEIWSIAM
jgi:hypothetical protein